jgi:hypothetical protein
MKTIVTISLLLLFILTAHADLREIEYKIGPQLFREGDRIQIEAVEASSSEFKVGETVTVKGSYTLRSEKEGKISIFVTQNSGEGPSRISPEQQFHAKEGKGNFEVSIQIQHEGYLHISFYPAEGGRGFGGVYFGEAKQMKEIEDWTLDWYLGGKSPEGHTDSVNPSN